MWAPGRHRSGGAIHLKKVYAATIAGRQINLRFRHIAKRRTEGADIGNEWLIGFIGMRSAPTGDERGCPRQCDKSLYERTP